MVSRCGQSFSVQRSVLTVSVVMVAVMLAGTAGVVEGYGGDSWHSIYECPGLMGNRHIYDKVVRVCDDCYNIYRSTDIAVRCRSNCFLNDEFKTCLRANERYDELHDFQRWISILSAGRK